MTVKTQKVLHISHVGFRQILEGISFVVILAFFLYFCCQLPRAQKVHKYKSQGKCCDARLKGGNALLFGVSHVPLLRLPTPQCLFSTTSWSFSVNGLCV